MLRFSCRAFSHKFHSQIDFSAHMVLNLELLLSSGCRQEACTLQEALQQRYQQSMYMRCLLELIIARGAHQNLSWVTDNTIFMDAFRDKGRVSPKLKEVAVKLVMYPDVGLRGAHYCAYNTLAKYVGEA